jgi:hypothetical protein
MFSPPSASADDAGPELISASVTPSSVGSGVEELIFSAEATDLTGVSSLYFGCQGSNGTSSVKLEASFGSNGLNYVMDRAAPPLESSSSVRLVSLSGNSDTQRISFSAATRVKDWWQEGQHNCSLQLRDSTGGSTLTFVRDAAGFSVSNASADDAVVNQLSLSISDSLSPDVVRPGGSIAFRYVLKSSLRPMAQASLISPIGEVTEVMPITYPSSWAGGAQEGYFFRLPSSAKPGLWTIKFTANFGNGDSATKTVSFQVVNFGAEEPELLSLEIDGRKSLRAVKGNVHVFRAVIQSNPYPASAYVRVAGNPEVTSEVRMDKVEEDRDSGTATFSAEISFSEDMLGSSTVVQIRAVNRFGQAKTTTYNLQLLPPLKTESGSGDDGFLVQRAGSQLVLKSTTGIKGNYSVFENGVLIETFTISDTKTAHVVEERITGDLEIRLEGTTQVPITMTRNHLWFDNVNLGFVSPGSLTDDQENTLDSTANGYNKTVSGGWNSRATPVTKFICTGIYGPGASFDDKVNARKRAKISCEFAEKANPNLDNSYWFQTKETSVPSFVNKVLVTVKGFEPELLAALENGNSGAEPSIPTETEPDGGAKPESSNAGYKALYVPVGTSTGMTVTVTKLSSEERPGSTRVNLTYKMENNTRSSEIVEGSFKLFFDDGTYLNQYGSFNKLFPTDSSSRSYSFEWTGSKKATFIEYEADFFASEPGSGEKWRVD